MLSYALKTANQMLFLIIAVLLLISGCVLYGIKQNKAFIFSAILLSVFCIRAVSSLAAIEKLEIQGDIQANIVATVTETPTFYSENNYGSCSIRVDECEQGIVENGSLLLLVGDGVTNLSVGDRVTAEVIISVMDGDGKYSFYSENLYARAEAINVVFGQKQTKGIYGFAGVVQRHIKSTLIKNTDNYGILLALITGERSYISDELYECIKISGVSHILVVSGMHFAVIFGFLFKAINCLPVKSIIRDLFLLFVLFLMMSICGFSVSVLRAGFVYVFIIIYRWLNRNGDSMLSLANAMILILILEPFAFFSIAFQLSFASTFGILVLANKIKDFFSPETRNNKITGSLVSVLSVSLSAYIATFLIVIYHFGYISTYSIIVNLLVSIPANYMLIFAVMGVVLGSIPYVSSILLNLSDLLAYYFKSVSVYFANLPISVIPLKNEKLLVAIILITIFVVFVYKTGFIKKLKRGDRCDAV